MEGFWQATFLEGEGGSASFLGSPSSLSACFEAATCLEEIKLIRFIEFITENSDKCRPVETNSYSNLNKLLMLKYTIQSFSSTTLGIQIKKAHLLLGGSNIEL